MKCGYWGNCPLCYDDIKCIAIEYGNTDEDKTIMRDRFAEAVTLSNERADDSVWCPINDQRIRFLKQQLEG